MTTAQDELTTAQYADEIQALQLLMAHYAHWGDTQQWDKFGSLFHDDAVIIVDAGPRPNPDADARIEVRGREEFIAGMSASLDGVQTAHNLFLPEITIDDDTHAHATWGLHDYVKTRVVNFNGYGHISHDYVKVDGHRQALNAAAQSALAAPDRVVVLEVGARSPA